MADVHTASRNVFKDVHRLKHTQVCEKTHAGEPPGAITLLVVPWSHHTALKLWKMRRGKLHKWRGFPSCALTARCRFIVFADVEELLVSEVSRSFSFVVKDVHRLKASVCAGFKKLRAADSKKTMLLHNRVMAVLHRPPHGRLTQAVMAKTLGYSSRPSHGRLMAVLHAH